ncbi:alpha/beta hydrolase [Elioraea tepidiphila]|jgi:pimeloyl-ACP methyl ester carboxylesterase|uniref:alpha/beta fold hydrolase n=1 Tax=Elioraea tepidiphila TaxID=457934 RepID=UPI002FDA6019
MAPPFAHAGGVAPRTVGRLERGDCAIHYEVTGEGPPIVFAHGLGGNHLSWWQQVAAFCPRYTCVSFSHRGFFPSTAPAAGVDPEAYAGDLAALLDHLRLERVRIVAQSMGGWTALNFTLAAPERVAALVMAATAGPIDLVRADASGGVEFAAWRERAATRNETLDAGVHPAMGARAAVEQPALHYLYRALDALSAGLDKEALRKRLHAARDKSPEVLASVMTPTLWITGEEDVVFPSFLAPGLAARMPNGRHVLVPRAGHSAYFERASVFNEAVGAFLAEIG